MKTGRQVLGSRRAFVTVYMAFAMLTLLPMVGLAIDFSVLYNVKARLQEACDAAVIGAGTEVQRSTNVNDPTQNANLQNTVLRFFNANFSPAPWNATQGSYSASITQDPTTKMRTITVTASYYVPMLFMRVLGINNSTVAAQAIADLRFVNLMIVVDRSGSVDRTGSGTQTNPQIIEGDLNQFLMPPVPPNTTPPIFVPGRDVVGMVSFGGNYYNDYQPSTNFQTAPSIGTAINKIFFDNNSTNTGEGLYQAWYQLAQLNQTGALNVILLITDGRPSAFTGSFAVAAGSKCTSHANKTGFIDSNVGDGNPWQFPPPANRPVNGVLIVSPPCNMVAPFTAGCEAGALAPNSGGCAYASSVTSVATDIPTIPATIGPITNITGANVPYQTTFNSTTGYFNGGGSNVSSPTAVRYAAFNYAYNVAKAIRTDTTYTPVIYCVGLNFSTASYPDEEPLDADFLATLANDQSYTSPAYPNGIYQSGQTGGKYYDVTYAGLNAALQDITSQILRLSAH